MLTLHPLTDKGNRWESCAVPLLYVLYKQGALHCGHCFTHLAVRSGKVVTLSWTSQKTCRNAVLSLCQPEEEGLGNEEWMKLCTKSLAWCVLIATHLYIYVLLKKSQPPSTFQLNNILDRLLSLLLTSWLSLTTAPPDSLGTAEVTATRRLTGTAYTQPVQRITL